MRRARFSRVPLAIFSGMVSIPSFLFCQHWFFSPCFVAYRLFFSLPAHECAPCSLPGYSTIVRCLSFHFPVLKLPLGCFAVGFFCCCSSRRPFGHGCCSQNIQQHS